MCQALWWCEGEINCGHNTGVIRVDLAMTQTLAMGDAIQVGQAMREAMMRAEAAHLGEVMRARRVGGGVVHMGPRFTRRVRHELCTLGRLGWGTRVALWVVRRVLA